MSGRTDLTLPTNHPTPACPVAEEGIPTGKVASSIKKELMFDLMVVMISFSAILNRTDNIPISIVLSLFAGMLAAYKRSTASEQSHTVLHPESKTCPIAEHLEVPPGYFKPGDVIYDTAIEPTKNIVAFAAGTEQMAFEEIVKEVIKDGKGEILNDPERRGELTGEHDLSMILGSKAVADRSTVIFKRIHDRFEIEYKNFVHNSVTDMTLRGFDKYGPNWTKSQKNQYVRQRRIAGMLEGLDHTLLPKNVHKLERYMQRMRKQLRFTEDTKIYQERILKKGFPRTIDEFVVRLFIRAAMQLLTDDVKELYQFRTWKIVDKLVEWSTNIILQKLRKEFPATLIPQVRVLLEKESFGRSSRETTILTGCPDIALQKRTNRLYKGLFRHPNPEVKHQAEALKFFVQEGRSLEATEKKFQDVQLRSSFRNAWNFWSHNKLVSFMETDGRKLAAETAAHSRGPTLSKAPAE